MKYIKLFIIFILSFFSFILLFFLIGNIYAIITPKIDIKSANKFYIYDINNKLIEQGNNSWVPLSEMGDNVINATLSVEDKNFYSHNGFDFLRITKAIFENIKNKEIVQGASTISQQYAKNLFLDFDKSWKRKWKEMWITFDLEYHYSKDEILEGYLNTINYGDGVYGINNAALYYFNKNVKDLTLEEASILAGIPNSPANYSPIDNYNKAKKRQEIVLDRMVKNNYITKDEKETAINKTLNLYGKKENSYDSSFLYYRDAVIKELSKNNISSSYLDTGGLKIYTTYDKDAQKAITEGNNKYVIDNVETAKVLLRSSDGAILGLIGGVNYNTSEYNRATDSMRQPGSTVKPFLYYKALENGFTASTTFLSKPTTFNFNNKENYIPKNSGNIYANKDISLIAAVAYSDNIYAIKTHLFLGEEQLLSILKELNITQNNEKTASMPLGTYETNIIDLAGAYATLSNGGNKITPHLIREVKDIDNNVIYKYRDKNYKKNLLNPSITFIISEILTSTYDTNLIDYTYPTCINMLPILTKKYAIKSGSTDTDAWVIGYNKDYVLASWSGYDDNKKIENNIVSNNKLSWATIMELYLKDKDDSWMKIPKDVVAVLVDPITGEAVTTNTKNKKIMYYIKGTEPDK